jgi:hypothetical protein
MATASATHNHVNPMRSPNRPCIMASEAVAVLDSAAPKPPSSGSKIRSHSSCARLVPGVHFRPRRTHRRCAGNRLRRSITHQAGARLDGPGEPIRLRRAKPAWPDGWRRRFDGKANGFSTDFCDTLRACEPNSVKDLDRPVGGLNSSSPTTRIAPATPSISLSPSPRSSRGCGSNRVEIFAPGRRKTCGRRIGGERH